MRIYPEWLRYPNGTEDQRIAYPTVPSPATCNTRSTVRLQNTLGLPGREIARFPDAA